MSSDRFPRKNRLTQRTNQNVQTIKQMLPKEIEQLILAFHDAYNTIENTKRINFVIESGYRNWLRMKTTPHQNMYNLLEREYNKRFGEKNLSAVKNSLLAQVLNVIRVIRAKTVDR